MTIAHFTQSLKKIITDSAADYTNTIKQGKTETNYPLLCGIIQGFETVANSLDKIKDDYLASNPDVAEYQVPVAPDGKE